MIAPLLFVLGALVVGLVFYDFLRTTISLSGLGPVSRWVTSGLWFAGSRLAVRSERRLGLSFRGLLGPSILTSIAGTWILLHLAGYTLMFRAGSSLVETQSGDPATWVQTAAFAGSALSTLGASKVQVTNGWWDILSMVAAVNGMIVLTLSVSFILNVLQTTNSARTFAARYHAVLSSRGEESRPDPLRRASTLGPDLCGIAVRLAASPLPGIFVPSDPKMDFPAAVCDLCDLLEAEGLRSREEGAPGTEVSELRWAIGLLGRSYKFDSSQTDVAAARDWARRHTLPRPDV
ncbi:hypothetical protein [uncultured Jannaschia sp.]|uniref:hypothetical protein n=1 Tax=uncultured Jannaschia sp. TaxID=293347 RepID=UPI0026376FB7|nr:hypothetical protein [uncultured Jannaschia sp.]